MSSADSSEDLRPLGLSKPKHFSKAKHVATEDSETEQTIPCRRLCSVCHAVQHPKLAELGLIIDRGKRLTPKV